MASSEPSTVIEFGRVAVAIIFTATLGIMFVQCNGASCDVQPVTAGLLSSIVLIALGLPPIARAYLNGTTQYRGTNRKRDD